MTELIQATFINDGSKLWNVAPDDMTKSASLWSVKKAIKRNKFSFIHSFIHPVLFLIKIKQTNLPYFLYK